MSETLDRTVLLSAACELDKVVRSIHNILGKPVPVSAELPELGWLRAEVAHLRNEVSSLRERFARHAVGLDESPGGT